MASPQEKERYTGDIQGDERTREQEYQECEEIEFSPQQHRIWADLYAGITHPQLMAHVVSEYHQGRELLALDPERIPSLAEINRQITPRTGWKTERTVVRYTKADDWYQKFAERTFLITDYLRTREQLDFTPEPDMFHDIVGHLPYLTLEFYAQIENRFAPVFLAATNEEREVIKRLAWYSTEFGLVKEANRVKIFGAGIISGRQELANTIAEIQRLEQLGLLDPAQDAYVQLVALYQSHEAKIDALLEGINQLHAQGEMASPESGWNVMDDLCQKLGIDRTGYLGGNVIIAPFKLESVAKIPKTVYALNPVLFLIDSWDQLHRELDRFFHPILERHYYGSFAAAYLSGKPRS